MATRNEVLEILSEVPLTMRFRQTDDGWWVAHCAEVPEAQTQGETKEEVRENLMDAVAFVLEDFTVEQLHEFREYILAEETELLAL